MQLEFRSQVSYYSIKCHLVMKFPKTIPPGVWKVDRKRRTYFKTFCTSVGKLEISCPKTNTQLFIYSKQNGMRTQDEIRLNGIFYLKFIRSLSRLSIELLFVCSIGNFVY